MIRRSACVLTALLCLTSTGAAQVGPTMEVEIPVHPSAVPGDGQVHLVYELHLTNWTRAGQVLKRVLVVDPRSGRTLRGYEGDALKSGAVIVGEDRSNVPDELASAGVEIPPGRRALVYLWLSVAPEDVPSSLSHRVLYEQSLPDSTMEVVEVETNEISLGPPPVVISPPVRGDNWHATSFGRQERRSHSRGVFTSWGHATIPQRFAVDWGRFVGGPGVTISQSFRFPGVEGNEGARAWGEEVLAVADGVVVAVTTGIPDNVGPERAVEITTETAGGNSVLLDIGSGHMAYYAHLQEKSLRVAQGDTVRVGEVLGLIGNSGNSGAPHLHFQITSGGRGPWDGEGVPFVIDRFELVGRPAGTPGTFMERLAPRQIERELVLPNHLVNFPEGHREQGG